MLDLFHQRRPWIIASLLCCYGALLGMVCWRFLVDGWAADRLEHWNYLSLALAGLLTLVALGRIVLLPGALYALGGLSAELLGVHTGLPFGAYRYLSFGPQLYGVPLLIPLAWAVLLIYVSQMFAGLALTRLSRALLGAAWMTLFDLAIDPLASGPLGCWVWLEPGHYYGVPWLNFAAWFGLSCVMLYLAPAIPRRNLWVRLIGLSVAACTLLTALSLGFMLAAAAAAALLAVHAAVDWLTLLPRTRTPRPAGCAQP